MEPVRLFSRRSSTVKLAMLKKADEGSGPLNPKSKSVILETEQTVDGCAHSKYDELQRIPCHSSPQGFTTGVEKFQSVPVERHFHADPLVDMYNECKADI